MWVPRLRTNEMTEPTVVETQFHATMVELSVETSELFVAVTSKHVKSLYQNIEVFPSMVGGMTIWDLHGFAMSCDDLPPRF